MPDYIIVGAGITGLTCAYRLKQRGASVLVLEEANLAGGKILTERVNGYLLESGPNSLRIENRETVDLIESVGLTARAVEASPNAKKRFILRNGRWVQAPVGPIQAVTTPLFSFGGKLRVLGEIFTSPCTARDETIESYFLRHFGRELYEQAADPFVTGIYAGDPTKLSVRHSFKVFWQLDQQYGSMIRGMLMRKKDPNRVKPRIISFPNGLGELIERIREELAGDIQFHKEALTLTHGATGYTLRSASESFTAPNIILALPAHSTAPLIESIAISLAAELAAVDYPPIAVAYLGFREDQFLTKIEGFGGLIPSKEGRSILGAIYSSSNFAGRAPDGHVLLTVLAGGARNRAVMGWSHDQILQNAEREVRALFQSNGAPVFRHARLWKRAIPQYNVGYDSVLNAISAAESANPGLHFVGNYRGGIAMGACIKSATELAASLV
ncbi:MAG: protoporphyrinogen oxidase [Bacteroidota bacterium]|nr:protoporphyrinogen oxidase [Bacteroidota bacterium]MDP4233745.1 protoporphyrinogen oxidase [Bacteroidota bacterium]MDP4242384.1 protoporphyrinogen oxidase [Bacteroidota bacterium]MDP4287506.1 protoporphyrinogen oxidase [Bacteroidota bacterium]